MFLPRSILTLPVFAITCAVAVAADNTLSEQEKKDGWQLLFDGRTGWKTATMAESKTPVEEGTLNPHGSGGYMLIHDQPWENFRWRSTSS